MIISRNMPPLGYQVEEWDVRVTARGEAFVLGDVVVFDMSASDGDVSTIVSGDENSIFANVIGVVAASRSQPGWTVGVCLEAIADNGEGRVRIHGRCKAFTQSSGAGNPAVVIGDEFVLGVTDNFERFAQNNNIFYALAMEATALGVSTRALREVLVVGDGALGKN